MLELVKSERGTDPADMGCAASDAWRDDRSDESPEGGSWKSYENIDMCMQGDAEIIWDWKSKATISQLKRTVEARGFSAFTVSSHRAES